jgi:hypothetical protein
MGAPSQKYGMLDGFDEVFNMDADDVKTDITPDDFKDCGFPSI